MDSSGSAEGPLRSLINIRVNVRLWEETSIVLGKLSDRYILKKHTVFCRAIIVLLNTA